MSLQTEFTGGELTPRLYAKPTAPIYQQGLKTCRNFIVMPTGGAINRPGSRFIGYGKYPDKKIRLEPFEFSADDTAVLEFGDRYIRFLRNGEYAVTRTNITNVSASNPTVITAVGHGFAEGEQVYIEGSFSGTTGVNHITNGEFDTDISSWSEFTNTEGETTEGSWDAANQRMQVDQVGYYQNVTCTKGEKFIVSVDAICDVDKNNDPPMASMHVVMVPDDTNVSPYWAKQVVTAEKDTLETLSLEYTTAFAGYIQVVLANHNGVSWAADKDTSWFDNVEAYTVLEDEFDSLLTGEWITAKNVTANTFEVWSQDGLTAIDTSAYNDVVGSGAVSNGKGIYEIESPYLEEHLMDLQVQQIADVMTIVHPDYSPQELTRYGPFNWEVSSIIWQGSNPDAPVNLTATPSGSPGGRTYSYGVTAVNEAGDESIVSNIVEQQVYETWDGDEKITLTWLAVSDAVKYRVYCSRYGVWGRIGETIELFFVDDNILPDTVIGGPPLEREIFPERYNRHPSTLAVHNQRMMYANSNAFPYQVWGTKPGNYYDLSSSDPIVADSTIDWYLASNRIDEIKHLLSWRKQLLLFTAGGLWAATAGEGGITALNYELAPNLGVGCSTLPPLQIGDNVVFAGLHKEVVYDMTYSDDAAGYSEVDRSVHANHLFKNQKIIQWSYQRRPYSVIWAVTDGGDLIAMTYIPSRQQGAGVWAWHRHDTQGTVESLCVVKEDADDVLYMSVLRTSENGSNRYIERVYPRETPDIYYQGVFLDSSISFEWEVSTNTATSHCTTDSMIETPIATATHVASPGQTAYGEETEITGLDHLAGKEVNIVADGEVLPPQTVAADGTLTIPAAPTVLHVGLGYTCDLEPLNVMGAASGKKGYSYNTWQGSRKRPYDFNIYIEESRGFRVGADENTLYSTPRLVEGSEMYTGEFQMKIAGAWQADATVFVRHENPLPLTILSIYPVVQAGS